MDWILVLVETILVHTLLRIMRMINNKLYD
jgi:hypothetical protein